MRKLREDLQQEYSGVNFSIMALGLIPRSAPIEITLSGNDLNQVMKTGNELKSVIEKIPGADNVRLSVEAGSPELKIIPIKTNATFGIKHSFCGNEFAYRFTGNDDATNRERTEYPVRFG